jgi:prepilin-type processing-associated H-X9-DG protein
VGDIMKQLNIVFVDGSSKSNIFLGDVPIIQR